MRINKHDTNGTKPLLGKGELGYDDYTAGGDTGRVYVGTGSVNIPQAKKAEVVAVDGKVDTHVVRVDNPHSVTKTQVGLGNVQNVDTTNASNITSGTLANARLANSGVTAGTYKSVTVDGKGIVTGGTNPTTLGEYGITDTYTKTETNTQISTAVNGLVDAAPGTLDTLNELAAALGDDPNFATTVTNNIATKVTKNADITAGTNTKITYDTKGLVTGGSTPTTLAGYSIADAYTKTEVDNTKISKVTSTDNAIVRFDGTAGDVQNSSVTINDNGDIGSGTQSFNGFGGSGFKNYIINGNFSIWQRGNGPFTNFTFSADRWLVHSSTATHVGSLTSSNGIQNRILHVQNTVAGGMFLAQAIELPYVGYAHPFTVGKKFTISIRVSAGTKIKPSLYFKYGVVGANPIIATNTPIEYKGGNFVDEVLSWTITINNACNITNNCLVLGFTSETAVTNCYVYQVQLEAGSVATPFEDRPYGLELSLCQRYYEIMLMTHATNTAYTCAYFKVTKRVIPTLVVAQLVGSGKPTITVSSDANMVYQDGSPTGLGTAGIYASAEL